MSKDKDPRIAHPGRPDPKPPGTSERGSSEVEDGDPGATEQVATEAEEPIENRFPDEDSGEHRESG